MGITIIVMGTKKKIIWETDVDHLLIIDEKAIGNQIVSMAQEIEEMDKSK